MKKLNWIFLLFVSFLLIMSSNVSAGSFRQTDDKNFGNRGITDNLQLLRFYEGNDCIDFIARKVSSSASQLMIVRNKSGNPLFTQTIENAEYGRIVQVYNSEARRFFYLVCLSKYIGDGMPGDFCKVMGYDPSDGKWWTYVDAQDFYNPVRSAPWVQVNKRGDLILSFSEEGLRAKSQQYTFFWNESTRNLMYRDDGFDWHK